MSGFEGTFTRDDKENLQYDDAAFFFFLAACFVCIIFPLLINIYYKFKNRKRVDWKKVTCHCKDCKANKIIVDD